MDATRYPASRTAGLIKVPPLAPDEDSRTYRVRAALDVHEWLSSMTAEERGAVMEEAFRQGLGSRPSC